MAAETSMAMGESPPMATMTESAAAPMPPAMESAAAMETAAPYAPPPPAMEGPPMAKESGMAAPVRVLCPRGACAPKRAS